MILFVRPINIQPKPSWLVAQPTRCAARANGLWVILAWGSHPFPSRTRKLSPTAPMVLHARVCGRVGRRPIKHKAPAGVNRVRGFLFSGLRVWQFAIGPLGTLIWPTPKLSASPTALTFLRPARSHSRVRSFCLGLALVLHMSPIRSLFKSSRHDVLAIFVL